MASVHQDYVLFELPGDYEIALKTIKAMQGRGDLNDTDKSVLSVGLARLLSGKNLSCAMNMNLSGMARRRSLDWPVLNGSGTAGLDWDGRAAVIGRINASIEATNAFDRGMAAQKQYGDLLIPRGDVADLHGLESSNEADEEYWLEAAKAFATAGEAIGVLGIMLARQQAQQAPQQPVDPVTEQEGK